MSDPFTTVVTAEPRYNLAVQEGGGLTLTMLGPAGPAGATGATGAAGPNEVTSATTSDGTADLSVSNITINSDGTNLGAFDIASGMFGIQMGTGDLYATLSSSNWYGTTFTGSHIQDVGTTDTPTFGNLTLASGTITTSQPLSLTQTWNAAGVTFTGLQVNVADTASASGSLLMDLRVGPVSRAKISKNGSISIEGALIFSGAKISAGPHSGNQAFLLLNQFYWSLGVGSSVFFKTTDQGIACGVNAFGLTGNTGEIGGTADVILNRDAANTLAQRNGANAQEFRLYGTTNTAVTEYERLKLKYNSATLSYQIGTEKGGTTTSARPLEFQTDGTTRMTIPTSGNIVFTQNIQGNRADFSGFYTTAVFNGGGYILAANGILGLYDAATTGFSLLKFGGGTTSFPALKRSSAILQARLADDSGYTTMDAQHRLQGTAPASATAAGTAGDIRYDADYIYICTATNTWKRTAISTWP